MNATLTELRRNTGKVLSTVIHRKKTVRLTQHGQTVAEITPRRDSMTWDELMAVWDARTPMDKATADEVAKNMAETRAAK